MESLTSLCDLVAQNPVQFADKLTWICNRCPQPEELRSGSPRVTRSELNAVLAISRFLSKCPDPPDPRPSSLALEFFRSIPASFAISFWPQSSSDSAAVSEVFSDYLGYLTLAAELSPDFSEKIAGLVGKVVAAAIENYNLSPVPRAFLVSLSKPFPSIVLSDGERLVEYLLHKFELRIAGDEATLKSCMGAVGSEPWLRQLVAAFEEERLEGLEKQGIAFKLITHVMSHVKINDQLLEQVRLVSTKQLQSLSEFLKIRKQDWKEQGQLLKARVKAKIAVYQAAAIMNIRSLPSPGALSMAAESCLLSVWRKLRICEELFDTLLSGVAQITTSIGGQPLWLLLDCVKSLVLAVCKRTNAWGAGSMFESAVKASCQIIESAWPNDRATLKTFISGLILMVDKDKPETSVVQLNVICLLADVTVAVHKSEVVDMILPFFIEILEDRASIPSLLRLRLLGAVSRIASLGSEKSYRETVVLMIRCYVSAVRSAESKTLASAAVGFS